jgi:hypothetical protein
MDLEPEYLVRTIMAERRAEAERWRRSSSGRSGSQPGSDEPIRRHHRLHLPVLRHRLL